MNCVVSVPVSLYKERGGGMFETSGHLTPMIELFSRAAVFKGIPNDAYRKLSELADTKHYVRNAIVFKAEDPCEAFMMVVDGLVRVSRYSALGKRLTYLLAGPADPLNLIGPFTGAPRPYVAEAAQTSTVAFIHRKAFLEIAFNYPQMIINIIEILGQAVDSSNSRILDMVEKSVIQRLSRILHTLYKKFGPILNFTAEEVAELTGTTTESALRVLSRLRKVGTIEKRRGQIRILKAEALLDYDGEELWI